MVEAGILGPDDRVELLRGVLAAVTPRGIPRAGVIQWLTRRLVGGTDPAVCGVRVQLPLRMPSTDSVPEPDIAIVDPNPNFDRHPETAALIIEVADSSAARDLREKAGIYAAARVPEYWVVGVRQRAVTVHRSPGPTGYEDTRTVRAGTQTPLDQRVPPVDLHELLGLLPPAA